MLFLPLYIDPGTGSMLFSLFIGIATAATFVLRTLFLKLKFILSGGKTQGIEDKNNIPYVIFSDHKRYWNVFQPICEEFEKREIDLVYYTCSPDDPALSADYKHLKAEFIGEGNKAFAKLNMLYADIVLATTPNLDVYQWKRSKNVKCYVHVPHYAGDLSDYRMFGLDHYDAVLTSGNNQIEFIRKIESLRPNIKRKELISVGSLTLDNLKNKYDSVSHDKKNNIPMILLAPSWGNSGILSRYGKKLLSALSNTKYKIVVRPHPQSIVSEKELLVKLEKEYPSIEWNYDNDNFDILNKADLLITDFSGIIFDYALVFDKPFIYADTNFDTLPYDADWIDEKIWSLRAAERIGIELKESEFPDIEKIINDALSNSNLEKTINEIRNECWENIGNSAVSSVDYLIKKEYEFREIQYKKL